MKKITAITNSHRISLTGRSFKAVPLLGHPQPYAGIRLADAKDVPKLLQTETLGHQVHFGTARPRGLRFSEPYIVKFRAGGGEQLLEAAALKYLGQQLSTRLQHLAREINCQFSEIHGARLVDDVEATEVGGHVRHYKIDPPARDARDEGVQHGLLAKVALYEVHAVDRIHRQEIRCDHPA